MEGPAPFGAPDHLRPQAGRGPLMAACADGVTRVSVSLVKVTIKRAKPRQGATCTQRLDGFHPRGAARVDVPFAVRPG